jgi:hypothetical protein
VKWDLVIIDEAHRLRNAHKPTAKIANAMKPGKISHPKPASWCFPTCVGACPTDFSQPFFSQPWTSLKSSVPSSQRVLPTSRFTVRATLLMQRKCKY